MNYRLVVYNTNSENKYDADNKYEYLGDAESILMLWSLFTKAGIYGCRHVEIYDLDGTRQYPESLGQ